MKNNNEMDRAYRAICKSLGSRFKILKRSANYLLIHRPVMSYEDIPDRWNGAPHRWMEECDYYILRFDEVKHPIPFDACSIPINSRNINMAEAMQLSSIERESDFINIIKRMLRKESVSSNITV